MEVKLPAAIKEISLDTATFKGTGTSVKPTYINFFYGANGAGKTTLAEVIESDTGVQWQESMPRENYNVLVYNHAFIERHFSNYDNLAGVFTIHSQNIKIQGQIAEQADKKAASEKQGRVLTKDKEDKDAAWSAAADKFRANCWDRTKKLREMFDAVIAGKKRKELFFDAILAVPSVAEHDVDELKKSCDVAFDLNSRPYHVFSRVSNTSTYGSLPGSELLDKAVTSSSETPFANFIKAINATDWVRQGHAHYQEQATGKCPYCQQPLPKTFEEDIAACFDAQYQQDIDALREFQAVYVKETGAILKSLNDNLQDVLPSVDLTEYKDKLSILEQRIQINVQRIEGKIKEPTSIVALEDTDSLLIEIGQIIDEINQQIAMNNSIVNDKRKRQEQCKRDVWAHMAFTLADLVSDYNQGLSAHKGDAERIDKAIAECRKEYRDAASAIVDLNKGGVNTQEAVDNINKLLRDSGFQGFLIVNKPGTKNTYMVVRQDEKHTPVTRLSEGERNFIAFLYFYQLVRGNGKADATVTYGSLEQAPEGTDTRDKIVVIDDPVSSMDSGTLFIVSSIVRELIGVCYNNTEYRDQEVKGDYIKQIFILTHNVYFHREITYKEVAHYKSTSFFIIRKADNHSSITHCVRPSGVAGEWENYNPVQNSYAALWDELKRLYQDDNASIPIKNVSRRILDYYFLQLCGFDGKNMRKIVLETNKHRFVTEVEGAQPDYEQYHLADALLQYLNSTTGIGDELFLSDDGMSVEQHKEVFKNIFVSLGQDQHYNMMMGTQA